MSLNKEYQQILHDYQPTMIFHRAQLDLRRQPLHQKILRCNDNSDEHCETNADDVDPCPQLEHKASHHALHTSKELRRETTTGKPHEFVDTI